MTPICPVCGQPLSMGAAVWRCPAGHSFDVARQGYVNLLTVDRKHSRHPGDTKQMVAARRAFLSAGHYAPIARALCRILARHGGVQTVLDAGCGEGYYLGCVRQAFPRAECWGVDVSKDAVRFAAAGCKDIGWLTATAAALPFSDGAFDTVLSMFALTVEEEFARVLQPGGIFVQVLAGEDHLMGLKQIIYPTIVRKDKELHPTYTALRLLESRTLEFDFSLTSSQQVRDLLAMTPHYWRVSKDGALRLAATQSLHDRAQVIFNVYTRVPRPEDTRRPDEKMDALEERAWEL